MSYRVSPFSALNQLNRELGRIFDEQPFPGDSLDHNEWTPRVDVSETSDAFYVIADLPGVSNDEIEISLHNNTLTLRGSRSTDHQASENNFARRERATGRFLRQFNLPDSADENAVTARAKNGVLEITIAKAKKAQPIAISVVSD